MDQVLGRALTVLGGAACYAVAFIWCAGNPQAFTVLTNAGAFMLGTIVVGAGQITMSAATKLANSVRPPPPSGG